VIPLNKNGDKVFSDITLISPLKYYRKKYIAYNPDMHILLFEPANKTHKKKITTLQK